MSISVNFYTFSKETNSTRRPGGDPVTYMCRLLEPVSLTTPTIVLNEEDPHKFNYVHIPKFGRYYFVTEWLYNAGLWSAYLAVDVLASWKTEIGASSQYVVRSAAAFDGSVSDGLYPVTATPHVERVSAENPFTHLLGNGCYVLGVINDDPNTMGCTSYYVLNNSQFRALCSVLMNDATYANLTELGQELTKSITSPFKYMTSCTWFPVPSFPSSGGVASLPYGYLNLNGVSASILASNSVYYTQVKFQPPLHPQNERGIFTQASPYTRYELNWPAVGCYSLDSCKILDNEIRCSVAIDPISGQGTVQCFADDAHLFTTNVQIGVPIQLSDMTVNYVGAATNLVNSAKNVVSNALTGNYAGAALGTAGGVFNLVSDLMPTLQNSGSNGSVAAYRSTPYLECTFLEIVEDDNTHRGRPLMERRTLSTIPGFIMCADAHIEIPATSVENDKIKMFMNGGFYYE